MCIAEVENASQLIVIMSDKSFLKYKTNQIILTSQVHINDKNNYDTGILRDQVRDVFIGVVHASALSMILGS